jgi:hypothetical protein
LNVIIETSQIYSVREDLKDWPLNDLEAVWFMNGRNFIEKEERKEVYAVISSQQIIKVQVLSPHTLALLAELIALSQTLEVGK